MRTNDNIKSHKVANSSTISEVFYDSFMNNLIVQFTNGSKYEYIQVPEEVYNSMITAESVGRFFAANVKSKFDFLKL